MVKTYPGEKYGWRAETWICGKTNHGSENETLLGKFGGVTNKLDLGRSITIRNTNRCVNLTLKIRNYLYCPALFL